jgi:hypothetical protein
MQFEVGVNARGDPFSFPLLQMAVTKGISSAGLK